MYSRINDIKYHYLVLMFVCAITFFANLSVDEPDIMESRNFITAREMLSNGNWLIPTMNGELRFEKPPLPTWLTAASAVAFKKNSNLFILRMPAAFISTLMIAFFYGLVLFTSRDTILAFISSIVLSTTFMVVKVGTTNSWDIYPYVFMLGAIYTMLVGIEKKRRSYFLLCGVFLAASFLSKGPVAFYGMLLPFLFSYILVFKRELILRNKLNLLIALATAAMLSLLWPLLVYLKSPEVFMAVMKKEVSTWGNKHVQPFWFYINVFGYTGGWITFSTAALFKPFMEKRVKNKKLYYFSYIWFLTTFIMLSAIPMKKERYGLPMYIPMAVMISQLLYFFIRNPKNYAHIKRENMILKIHLILMSMLAFSVPVLFYINGFLKGTVPLLKFIFIFTLFTLLGGMFAAFIRKKADFKIVLLLTVAFILSLQLFAYSFFEINMRGKTTAPALTLAEVQKSKLFSEYDFYTTSEIPDIMNVWRVGKTIKPLRKLDLSSLNSPIVLIGEHADKFLESFPKNFKILKKLEFYESRKGKKKIELLLIEKI